MRRREFLATAAAGGLAITAGCSGVGGGASVEDWTEGEGTVPSGSGGRYTGLQGGPTHRGVADGTVGTDLGLAWSAGHPSEPTGQQTATPAIVDDVVYAVEGTIQDGRAVTYVTARDLESGDDLWEHAEEGTNSIEDVAYADGVVLQLVGATLLGIDAASGEERWRLRADLDVTPAAAEGTVYVTGAAYDATTLFALDVASGDERWSIELEEPPIRPLPPAVHDGVVYHVEEDLVGRDVADGRIRWTGATDRTVVTAPTVTDDRVYVGTEGNRIAAIDRATGEQDWSTEIESGGAGGRGRPSSSAVTDEQVVATGDWATTVLEAESGERVWGKETGGDGPPVVAGDTVFVAGLNELEGYALEDGRLRGRFESGNEAGSPVSPAIVEGVVCYPSDELYALASTG